MQRSDRYASGGAVVLEALKALLPPEAVSVAEFAARNRWLANEGGGYVGHWSHAEAPYLIGPMETLTDHAYQTIAVVGPGQCGKTETPKNWLMYSACSDPADMLWYSSTEFLVSAFVKTSINSMIEVNPPLKERLGRASSDNSLSFKRFGHMSVQFMAATGSTLISKSGPRIVADEYDAICESMGSPGIPADVKPILDVRRQTFGLMSKLYCTSHPDLAGGLKPDEWKYGVMSVYRDSDRRVWWWRCPECGMYSSPNPTASRVMTLNYDPEAPIDEIADMARLLCPENGCLIEDRQRRAMNLTGKWIGLGQQIDQEGNVEGELLNRDIAGFWITGLMSPFILGGIGRLARARVQAERDFALSNDPKALRQVLSKQWGLPMERPRKVAALDGDVIAARAASELVLGWVPIGVRFLTVFIDVQANRFEMLVRGWGEGGESWVVDYRQVPADPAVNPADWDKILDLAMNVAWPLADRSGRGMKPRLVGYDSGGADGVTQQAYDVWRRLRRRRAIRFLGKIDGREVWTVLPCKGMGGPNPATLQVNHPDTERRDRLAAARGELPIGQFAANEFKDRLALQLAKADAGPWAVHFPAALRAQNPPHPFFDGLVAETRGPKGTWAKVSATARNEPLDLMVGCDVLAHLTGLSKIDWTQPPPWAAPWDGNVNVAPMAREEGRVQAVTAPAPAGAAAPAPPPRYADAEAARLARIRKMA